MQINVVAPDPTWPNQFAQEAARMLEALGASVGAIHHIGSTAVPGLFAKPVIDILLEVPTLSALDEIAEPMTRLGYEGLGEFGIPGRRYFRKNDALGARTHQVHAFLRDAAQARRHVAFRDYLIAHPDVAAAYGTLKRSLAQQHRHDMEAYMDGKDPFINEHEARAITWSPHLQGMSNVRRK